MKNSRWQSSARPLMLLAADVLYLPQAVAPFWQTCLWGLWPRWLGYTWVYHILSPVLTILSAVKSWYNLKKKGKNTILISRSNVVFCNINITVKQIAFLFFFYLAPSWWDSFSSFGWDEFLLIFFFEQSHISAFV